MLRETENVDDFLQKFKKTLPDVLKHDFIAESQGKYLNDVKNSLQPGKFLVTLDFSENYSFHVQNAIQSQHWSKDQASLHVYVIYYKSNDAVRNLNFVVFSEYENHDATGVHLYNSKLIQFLKDKFGERNVKKIIYFSDGAGSQYKNRFNFLNLLFHETDFHVPAEWHFFATAHGKGACDGIGGCVKRNAYRASLQDKSIVTTQELFEWAKSYFKKIEFNFCSLDEYKRHEEYLKERFSTAKTINGTRAFHSFKPCNDNSLECKIISNYCKSSVIKVIKSVKK